MNARTTPYKRSPFENCNPENLQNVPSPSSATQKTSRKPFFWRQQNPITHPARQLDSIDLLMIQRKHCETLMLAACPYGKRPRRAHPGPTCHFLQLFSSSSCTRKEMSQSLNPPRRGAAGNVIAALATFFIPGLGQLVQGRLIAALFFFVTTAVLYFFSFLMLPWPLAVLIHLWAIINAATYQP
jgi:hypothetical protein